MEEIKSMGRNNHQAKMAVELEKGADKISGIKIEEQKKETMASINLNLPKTLTKAKDSVFANIAGEDDNLDKIQLNLDEDPVTAGSLEEAVKVEEAKMEKCILSHSSSLRLRWDLWIILLVLYNCIQIPLQLGF